MEDRKETKMAKRTNRISNKKSKFYCPESPYILWGHGLIFAECPINKEDRDMRECESCPLRGEAQTYNRKNSKRNYQKDMSKLEKRSKEQIPNIGKTYTSDHDVSD